MTDLLGGQKMNKGTRPDFILNEDGEIVAVNLSSDACAEHECGIESIMSVLGFKPDAKDRSTLGVKARTVTLFNAKYFFFQKGKTHTCLTFEPMRFELQGWKNFGRNNRPEKIAAAWDDGSFGIVVENSYQKFLEDLYEAFKKKDVAIYFGGSRLLMAPGLIIAIASRIPEEARNKLYQIDESRFRLNEEVLKTGIYEKLKKAGKIYYALSPRWKDKAETEITFHLNPQDQENDRYGWYSLQDLLDWIEDKGPIPVHRT